MATSQEQIAANIAATHKRRAAHRIAQRAAPEQPRFAEISGQLIGFVVNTRHGKFKPFIGKVLVIPEDDDAIINVVGGQPPQETLVEALAFYAPDEQRFAMVLKTPVPSGGMMGHWLKHMLS